MLYKYADINDNFTINNLINNQLGFNRIENFNDPFDTNPKLDIDKNDIISANISDELKKTCLSLPKSQVIDIAFEGIRKPSFTDKYGVTCFSKTNDNILMWSHYANSHKGICLGFDLNENNLENFIDKKKNIENKLLFSNTKYRLLPIKYSSIRPTFKIFSNNYYEQAFDMLSIKNSIWKYENEYRIFLYNKNDKNVYFPLGIYYNSNYLKEIILGLNFSINNFIKLYNTINNHNINLKMCFSNKEYYKLDIYPIPRDNLDILYKNLLTIKSLYTSEIILPFELDDTFNSTSIPVSKLNKTLNILPVSNILCSYPFIFLKPIQGINTSKDKNDFLSLLYLISTYIN